MRQILLHTSLFAVLTLLTQIGGLAWLAALRCKPRLLAFLMLYAAMSVATQWAAPLFGRQPLNCWANGPLQVQSWIYCALNRNFVSPELASVLSEAAHKLDKEFPGTQTLVLDANFPFLDGFPLLPHLSHDDGDKADIAFFYRTESHYIPGATRSPIGYFAFEDGPTNCKIQWLTLRWNLRPLQGFWLNYSLEPRRTRTLLRVLLEDKRVGKVLLEPHLQQALNLSHAKLRFQGCRAARHDDHIHIQL